MEDRRSWQIAGDDGTRTVTWVYQHGLPNRTRISVDDVVVAERRSFSEPGGRFEFHVGDAWAVLDVSNSWGLRFRFKLVIDGKVVESGPTPTLNRRSGPGMTRSQPLDQGEQSVRAIRSGGTGLIISALLSPLCLPLWLWPLVPIGVGLGWLARLAPRPGWHFAFAAQTLFFSTWAFSKVEPWSSSWTFWAGLGLLQLVMGFSRSGSSSVCDGLRYRRFCDEARPTSLPAS
jgi:hypothetical protein